MTMHVSRGHLVSHWLLKVKITFKDSSIFSLLTLINQQENYTKHIIYMRGPKSPDPLYAIFIN